MADVIVGDRQHHVHSHSRSISGLDTRHLRPTAPKIEMVPNPAFSFPMKPLRPTDNQPADPATRPTSLLLQPSSIPNLAPPVHKRAASAALPSFSFNSSDTSGRHDQLTPPRTPDENSMDNAAFTSKRGHRRGGSEFVGGDSRFGVSSAISSSPTKTSVPQLPVDSETGSPSAKRRTHAHRRSEAVSSHDLSQIMSSGDKSPRLSSSLPNSPLNMPVSTFERSASSPTLSQQLTSAEPEQGSRSESPARPVSRPRVEFSEQIEIIPRPLSTISSETESSMSTIRGHSVNNSISSVLSLGSSSPASPRARGQLDPSLTLIAESRTKRSSIELSKRLEREGEWLKSKASDNDMNQLASGASESTAAVATSRFQTNTDQPVHDHPAKRQKRQSLGQTFGFDRRRSEPSISAATSTASRVSSVSLLDVTSGSETPRPATAHTVSERRFSGHRLKQWALSKLHRKSRDNINNTSHNPDNDAKSSSRPESAESVDVPGKISVAPHEESPVAETDLDAVFGAVDLTPTQEYGSQARRVTYDVPVTTTLQHEQSAVIDDEDDDGSPMLDLDAATEPLRTPPLGSSHHRRPLHSDRSSKQGSSSSNYIHRRAESDSALMTFNYNRTAPSSHKSMEDVFEEDEEEEQGAKTSRVTSRRQNQVLGMGITVVDADDGTTDSALSSARRQPQRDAARPSTSYISPSSRLLVPTVDRPASLVDEVIVEESSPVDEAVGDVEIVHAHEEPRACSLEKLSDSSEASTLLGASLGQLAPSSEIFDNTTPTTLQTSAFPSPDLWRRQGSFEASRVGTSASSLADTRTTSSCMTGEGTSASSLVDTRTMSSYMTGEGSHEMRMSVDDVPSLTSSNSTTMSTTTHGRNSSKRDFSGETCQYEAAVPRNLDPDQVAARRKKRASIQSLSQLMSGSFGSKTKLVQDESRPQTASVSNQNSAGGGAKKRDNRLKKLMFWRSRQSLRQAALDDSGEMKA